MCNPFFEGIHICKSIRILVTENVFDGDMPSLWDSRSVCTQLIGQMICMIYPTS